MKIQIKKIIGFIVGVVLIFLGGIDLMVTTVPGIGLVVWSLTGEYK